MDIKVHIYIHEHAFLFARFMYLFIYLFIHSFMLALQTDNNEACSASVIGTQPYFKFE